MVPCAHSTDRCLTPKDGSAVLQAWSFIQEFPTSDPPYEGVLLGLGRVVQDLGLLRSRGFQLFMC